VRILYGVDWNSSKRAQILPKSFRPFKTRFSENTLLMHLRSNEHTPSTFHRYGSFGYKLFGETTVWYLNFLREFYLTADSQALSIRSRHSSTILLPVGSKCFARNKRDRSPFSHRNNHTTRHSFLYIRVAFRLPENEIIFSVPAHIYINALVHCAYKKYIITNTIVLHLFGVIPYYVPGH
jgi:hypothetical protein